MGVSLKAGAEHSERPGTPLCRVGAPDLFSLIWR